MRRNEVDTIAGYSVDALCQKFAYIFSADNKEVLEYRFSKNFYVDDFLSYLGVKNMESLLKYRDMMITEKNMK